MYKKLLVASFAIVISFFLPLDIAKHVEAGPVTLHPIKLTADLHTAPLSSFQPLSVVPITPQQYVQAEASKYGWGSGYEWTALQQLISNESGFKPTAENPSSAYGLFQFLDSTWAKYGCHKTASPAEQSRCGLIYIKQRYSSPSNALNFWLYEAPKSNGQHWY